MTSNSPSNQAPSRTDWHAYFSEAIRLALAPLVLVFAAVFLAIFTGCEPLIGLVEDAIGAAGGWVDGVAGGLALG